MSKIPVLGWTHHQAITPDGRYVLSTHGGRGFISVVDLQSNTVAKYIKTGLVPNYTLITKDGKRAFISSRKDDKLVAIDTQSGETRSLSLVGAPYHLNSIDGTGKVYVSSRKKPIIWVVDQKTMKILSEIKLPAGEGHQMAVVN